MQSTTLYRHQAHSHISIKLVAAILLAIVALGYVFVNFNHQYAYLLAILFVAVLVISHRVQHLGELEKQQELIRPGYICADGGTIKKTSKNAQPVTQARAVVQDGGSFERPVPGKLKN